MTHQKQKCWMMTPNVGKQAVESPGVGDKTTGAYETEDIQGVDDTEEEIPGVDDAKETPGVGDDAPETTYEPDEAEVEEKNIERTSGIMNLHRQPRKEYNRKNYDNIFKITDKKQSDGIILMQLKCKEDSGNFDVTEEKIDKVEAKYMFLAKTLVWKEVLDGGNDASSDALQMMSPSWPNTSS